MKRLWILYKTEMKLALREFSGILFGIMLPVGIILIMGTIFGEKLWKVRLIHSFKGLSAGLLQWDFVQQDLWGASDNLGL